MQVVIEGLQQLIRENAELEQLVRDYLAEHSEQMRKVGTQCYCSICVRARWALLIAETRP